MRAAVDQLRPAITPPSMGWRVARPNRSSTRAIRAIADRAASTFAVRVDPTMMSSVFGTEVSLAPCWSFRKLGAENVRALDLRRRREQVRGLRHERLGNGPVQMGRSAGFYRTT